MTEIFLAYHESNPVVRGKVTMAPDVYGTCAQAPR